MGKTCSTYGSENMKGKDYLGDQNVPVFEDNIKMYLKEMVMCVCVCVNLIHSVAQDSVQWRALVVTVINLRVS
jgi:hypothetical protein